LINPINFDKYKTVIFDCDGVILNSNKIKTDAFFQIAKSIGTSDNADQLVRYHKQNGGVSRNKKFSYFITKILNIKFNQKMADDLCNSYGDLVISELIECEINEHLAELKNILNNSKWMVISGGNQNELRYVFNHRDITYFFEKGIYGSPDSKEDIFAREIERQNIIYPAIFIGDSEYDYLASNKFDIDFLFISQWTEFKNWKEFCAKHFINHIRNFDELT
jgi:phosphoglycolate phosphatase-like HAD superfamily hydrolase